MYLASQAEQPCWSVTGRPSAGGSCIVSPGNEQMLSVPWWTRVTALGFLMEERLQSYVCHQNRIETT